MPDPTPSPDAPDRDRIDVHQEQALRHWARKLDTTPEQIRAAVAAVGDRADQVELHLKGSHATTNSDQVQRAGG